MKFGILDRSKPIVFIHVPKCAGSSVRRVLKSNLGKSVLLHYRDEVKNLNPEKISLEQANSVIDKHGQCVIYGHFNANRGFGVSDSVAWASQFVTILREPFEQFISAFKYSNRNNPSQLDNSDFEIYLENNKPNYLNHFPVKVTEHNYKEVVCRGFKYIGFDIDKTLALFFKSICIDANLSVPRLNRSPDIPLSFGRFRERYEKLNPLEIEVYRFAKDVWFDQ